ncbi:hypothetical protein PALB_22310 [Pseudoalteromonas luteoviolacea B = ATCC 29581]|nr:hypothetical protein PALB_22310 [Pseudoalteromonas luteoviolacea B = ATCC 29581]
MKKLLVVLLSFAIFSGCTDKNSAPANKVETQDSQRQDSRAVDTAVNLTQPPVTQKRDVSLNENTDVDDLYQQLNALTENKQCNESAQCKALPVGKRACGGPSSYVVFSTNSVDQNDVESLTAKITAMESQINALEGRMSICEHVNEPLVQCSMQQCTTTEQANPEL